MNYVVGHTRSVVRALGALSLVGLALLACKQKKASAGDPCKAEAQPTCQDERSLLACRSNKLVAVPCNGPGGCTPQKPAASCDISGNQTGDTCPVGAESVCSADGRSIVECDNGQARRRGCEGPKGCRVEAGAAKCDGSIGQIGDYCPKNGTFACTTDQKSRLTCKNNKLVHELYCRGEKGCSIDAEKNLVFCDTRVAWIGDPCTEDRGACTMDGKSSLKCKNGRFAFSARCNADRRGCYWEKDKLNCWVWE